MKLNDSGCTAIKAKRRPQRHKSTPEGGGQILACYHTTFRCSTYKPSRTKFTMAKDLAPTGVQWPESASSVKLLIPSELSKLSSEKFCCIEWNPNDRHMAVVSADARTVLDSMCMDDVIGASLAVQLNGGAEVQEIRATSADPPSSGGNAPLSETVADTQAHATLNIYCYPRRRDLSLLQRVGLKSYRHPVPDPKASTNAQTGKAPRVAAHRVYSLAPVEDLKEVQCLVQAIQSLSQGSSQDNPAASEKLLVLVNPVAGKGHALKACETTLCPMLDQAGIRYVVTSTTHVGHASELIRNSENSEHGLTNDVTGIVVVGGDGVFHEVVNGLKAKDPELLGKLKLGMLPCGTGSGLAASIAHASGEECDIVSSSFLVWYVPSVLRQNVHTFVLPLTLAVHFSINRSKRHCVWADTSLYATKNHAHTGFLTFSWGLVADVDMESECIRWLGTTRFDVWAVVRILFLRTQTGTFSYTTEPVKAMPSLDDPVPSDWTTIQDQFILFWASQVTHASMGFHQSPLSHIGDGVFQVMMIRKPMSRLQMVKVLLSMDAGQHTALKGVEMVQCTAWRLEPTGSFNVVDGERVEDGVVQAQVVPKSMQVFGKDVNC